jgi:twitching motility protein PilT
MARLVGAPDMNRLEDLLAMAVERGASDLHLVAGAPPALRINGEIILGEGEVLTATDLAGLADETLSSQQAETFQREWEVCTSLHFPAVGRVRATLYRRDGHPEFSFRFSGEYIATREDLGLPQKLDDLARRPNGLILITGPTGSGKTTTLNYLVDLVNGERRCKIVTIEDPIEFVHHNKRAVVVQQEVLSDTHSFNRALLHVLRQDPDVIVIGEIRDHEAVATTLTAAETGHLVIATLHSPSVVHALERIVGVFEGAAQRQIILQLSSCLLGILAQELVPSVDRARRTLAYELLVANSAVRNVIREN